MTNSPFFQKNVLITGGSAGIGLATAVEFVRRGARVFLLARDEAALQSAAERILQMTGQAVAGIFPADVGARPEVENAVNLLVRQAGALHTVVLNAGINTCGYFGDISMEDFERTWRTNYLGALYTLKAAWPHLAASGEGRVGFLSSVAGFTGLIGYTSYAPTKFALTGLAEAIRMEGKKCGIRTTVIFPPDVDTAMYRYEQANAVPEAKALSKGAGVVQPERVARRLVRAMERGKFEVLLGGEGRLIRVLKGVRPGLYYFIVDRMALQQSGPAT